MQTLLPATRWPFFAILTFFALLWGCQKDRFDSADTIGPLDAASQRVSLEEAKAYYNAHKTTNSFDGEYSIDAKPLWAAAYMSTSQSGREHTVVPTEDSLMRAMNNGRAGAKMTFSKNNHGDIVAGWIVYMTDSSYYASVNGNIDFATFTGAFALFDLNSNFKGAVYLHNGALKGGTDTLNVEEPGAQDRECAVWHVGANVPHISVSKQEVASFFGVPAPYSSVTIWDCEDSPSGGGPTGWNPSENPVGGGSGGPIAPNAPNYDWWSGGSWIDAITQGVPIGIFVTNNLENTGVTGLPPGLSVEVAVMLWKLNAVFGLTPEQITGLSNSPDCVVAIYNAYEAQGEAFITNNVLPFLDEHTHPRDLNTLRIVLEMTPENAAWLLNNPAIMAGVTDFLVEYEGVEDAEASTEMLVDFMRENGITNPIGADLSNLGADDASCGYCFAVAMGIEYAMLKIEDPGPNPNTDPFGAWRHDTYLKAKAAWNVSSGGVHLLLDGVGIIPGAEIADLASAGIYTLEGNYLDASLSLSAAVPFAGWLPTGAKYARKVTTMLGTGKKVTLVYVVRNADGKIQFGENLESASRQLRTVLKTPTGYQAHHIIPWEHWNHPVIQKAADVGSNDAFHMNELLNGISLPTTTGLGLPQHIGSHPDYSNRVLAGLNEIEGELGPNMTSSAALQKLTTLINRITAKIRATPGGTINDVSW